MIATGDRTLVASIFEGADHAAVALIEDGTSMTYGELSRSVAERAAALALGERSVVVLTGANSIEYVVSYLAVLAAGHVPLLAGSHVDRLVSRWQPGAVVRATSAGTDIEHHDAAPFELHPDLALLLSTSGSTGTPKLVRLSTENVSSNAGAIADYLHLGAGDRGISSLPLHYCYGLSVLHSHLVAGAAVVMTEASVVDPCFTAAFREHGVTNLAGVPHTFELLERAGAERLRTPALRFLTQAGGRLDPSAVERWVTRTERWGAQFYVMYGQTEATARMAYLPPSIARRRPGAIGVPIPGGSLHIRSLDGWGDDAGELVYRGPNVMLGYATTVADLGGGPSSTELATGDIARFHADDGVFEIVGRRSRFVKPFGVRVDLDAVEQELASSCAAVAVGGDDEHIVVAAPGASANEVARTVSELVGLPPALVVVDNAGAVPRTESGKVDYDEVRRRGAAMHADRERQGARPAESVAGIYSVVLGRADVTPDSTFVSLGGDSLSYVECSIRLERLLGHVPDDWHVRPVADLTASARRRHAVPRLDTTVVLRAVGICAIVSTHMGLWYFPGGAHLLLAVVGFNLSRFQLPIVPTAARIRAGLRTVARTAVPTVLWVGVGMLLVGGYGVGTLALVNNYAGGRTHDDGRWHFWFIEVFVHLCVLTTALLAIPAVRRLERRYSYAFPLVLFIGSLALRLDWADFGDAYNLKYRTHGVAWFFLLGWLVHRSSTSWQRVLTSALCVLTIPGFFDRPQREWFIAACLVALIWLREVPLPRPAIRPVAAVAAASMWILITHFRVWPPLDRALDPWAAYVLTILAGVLSWFAVEQILRAARRPIAQLRASRTGALARRPLAAALD